MENFLTPEIIETLKTGWYFVMFALMITEWPFVTMGSAFLASFGIFNIFIVAILGWLGDVIWDFLLFAIGRFGIKFFQKKVQMDEQKKENFIHKLDNLIQKNLFLAIVIIKFIPYAPPIWLPYIGRSNVPLKKFLFYTALASLPVPLFSAIIGFNIGFFKEIWTHSTPLEITLFILGFLGILAIWFFGFYFIKKKITEKLGDSEIILSETKNEKTEKIDAKRDEAEPKK